MIKLTDYTSFSAYETALCAEATLKFSNVTINHPKFGIGQIISVQVVAQPQTNHKIGFLLAAKTEFEVDYRAVPLTVIATLLSDSALATECLDYTAQYDAAIVRNRELQAAEFLAKLELKKQQKQEASRQHRAQLRQEKMLRILDNQLYCKPIPSTAEGYRTLGWLAANIRTISASIPQSAQGWFVRHFGGSALCTVVPDDKKTSGGYAMKWGPAFSASIKEADESKYPVSIAADISNKKLNNTSLIFQLVTDYGFEFRTNQDIEAIKANIPAEALSYFEAGMN